MDSSTTTLELASSTSFVKNGKSNFKLVLVGGGRPEEIEEVEEWKRGGYVKDVVVMGKVNDETLASLYRGGVLVYLSVDEGFGLPVQESLMAGGRVVASDIEVLREVVRETYANEENVVFVHPASVRDIWGGLSRLWRKKRLTS